MLYIYSYITYIYIYNYIYSTEFFDFYYLNVFLDLISHCFRSKVTKIDLPIDSYVIYFQFSSALIKN